LAIAFSLAALADWLFYGERIGISAVVFALAVTGGSLLANFSHLNRKQALLAGVLVLAGLVPAIEEFNAVSLAFIVLAHWGTSSQRGPQSGRPLSPRSHRRRTGDRNPDV
jgi:hypothetical protein